MRVRLLFAFILLGTTTVLADDNPILFTVGDMAVTRSEFEQSYLKNNTISGIDRKTVADYLELYVVYKLKVKAALDSHIDTTASFKKEYLQCVSTPLASPVAQETVALPVSSSSESYAEYERMKRNVETEGLVCPAQIFIRVPQKAHSGEQRQAELQIESIYRELLGGADFGSLARQYSEDETSASKKGVMGWYTRGQLLKEIEDEAFRLMPGEMSRPFLSTIGYHIIMMVDRKQLEPYDQIKEDVAVESAQRRIQRQISNQSVSGAMRKSTPVSQTIGFSYPKEESQKVFYEGLLLYEQSKHSVEKQAAEDEQALAYYFKKNKKKYRRKGFKPKSYTEVREQVVADLQLEMEKHWIADLRQKYPVNINKKVLKTVNNHH
ncbi:MAG: peptidyl-prolyl cis-trans isomerase [Prevotella sp.]|nr:peptidyl-prolyl cis-trans isomerase [Prevotella sp.]